MEKAGIEPLPDWAIDHIPKWHNDVLEKKKYKPSGKDYPEVR
jgi:hypothetical protein|tara:strand:- start:814 stop:939 length:126 start_codon:yes stop_codon:yes gene_type:complete